MKKVLTVAVCVRLQKNLPDCALEGIEILYIAEGQSCAEFLKNAVKSAKGKYTVIVDGDFVTADLADFLSVAEKDNSDIIIFKGGYCFKTAVLRGLNAKNYGSRYYTEISAALCSKTVRKVEIAPVCFKGVKTLYSVENEANLAAVVREFGAVKAKLTRDVYTFTFDIICARLVTFYMSAMVAIREKKVTADSLVAFDKALKCNIVLYLALGKRFTAADLNKLREKNFNISYFTARKFAAKLKK